jgi:hypothetical protein
MTDLKQLAYSLSVQIGGSSPIEIEAVILPALEKLVEERDRANEALRAALQRYGNHEVVEGSHCCAVYNNQTCNCGFDLALLGEK